MKHDSSSVHYKCTAGLRARAKTVGSKRYELQHNSHVLNFIKRLLPGTNWLDDLDGITQVHITADDQKIQTLVQDICQC